MTSNRRPSDALVPAGLLHFGVRQRSIRQQYAAYKSQGVAVSLYRFVLLCCESANRGASLLLFHSSVSQRRAVCYSTSCSSFPIEIPSCHFSENRTPQIAIGCVCKEDKSCIQIPSHSPSRLTRPSRGTPKSCAFVRPSCLFVRHTWPQPYMPPALLQSCASWPCDSSSQFRG